MAFSENLESFKEFATGAAQSAAKKTRQIAAIAKANISILGEEDKIKKAQLELGKLYYRDFIIEEEPDEAEYLPWCDKITGCMRTIENLKAEIETMHTPEAKETEIIIDVQPEEEPVQEAAAQEETVSEEIPIEVIVEDDDTAQ